MAGRKGVSYYLIANPSAFSGGAPDALKKLVFPPWNLHTYFSPKPRRIHVKQASSSSVPMMAIENRWQEVTWENC